MICHYCHLFIALDYPPTAKELSGALGNLKNRKAGELKSGIFQNYSIVEVVSWKIAY